MLKKIKFISLLILSILIFSTNKSNANLNNVSCENLITNSKTNIVYGNNFAKEEMSPNIWLFFQKISLVNNNLNLIDMALAFTQSLEDIESILIGICNLEQLKQIVSSIQNVSHLEFNNFDKWFFPYEEILDPRCWPN